MDKPRSLAEQLGLITPFTPQETTEEFPKNLTPEQFCQRVLNSPEFRRYIINGIVVGDLPSQVIIRLMDQGWGMPVKRLEVKDTTAPLESLTVEQLESRALLLAETARKLRDSQHKESVH